MNDTNNKKSKDIRDSKHGEFLVHDKNSKAVASKSDPNTYSFKVEKGKVPPISLSRKK